MEYRIGYDRMAVIYTRMVGRPRRDDGDWSGNTVGKKDSWAEYENRSSYTGMIFQGHSMSSANLLSNGVHYDYGDLDQL